MAAETAWQGRRVDETRRWVEQGITSARQAGSEQSLTALLSLAATVANLRGEYARAKAYLDEIELLRPARPAGEVEAIPSGGTLIVALANPVPAKEPSHIGFLEEAEVLALAFERLVSTDDSGHLVPSLCEEWDVAADGMSMRLKIRDGIQFHDGTPLNAQAVKQSFEHAARSGRRDTAAYSVIEGFDRYRAGEAQEITGVEIQSEREMVIHLREPLPVYPALLTDTSSGIARVVDGVISGTGPFSVASHDAKHVVMEKNPELLDCRNSPASTVSSSGYFRMPQPLPRLRAQARWTWLAIFFRAISTTFFAIRDSGPDCRRLPRRSPTSSSSTTTHRWARMRPFGTPFQEWCPCTIWSGARSADSLSRQTR